MANTPAREPTFLSGCRCGSVAFVGFANPDGRDSAGRDGSERLRSCVVLQKCTRSAGSDDREGTTYGALDRTCSTWNELADSLAVHLQSRELRASALRPAI